MRPDHRDAAVMSTEEPESMDALVVNAAPGDRAPGDRRASGDGPRAVNKLHEWAAAVLIMALLAAILIGFLFFVRGVSL
jgi:hypothetical protein